MFWILGTLAGLLFCLTLLIAVFHTLGKSIPEEHTASSTVDVPASAHDAFALLDNVADQQSWNRSVTRIEMLPDQHGLQTCRMHMGRNSFVLVRTKHLPPSELERTIIDDHGPFSGTWLYSIASTPSGCQIKLTETGRVKSPIPRAMMKHLFGYHYYLNSHLKALAARLGGTSAPRKV